MTNIVPFDRSKLPASMRDRVNQDDDLGGGVTGGFAVMSFRGRVWRVKHQGEELTLTNEEGDPKASFDAVMVKASPSLSKLYYEKAYVEGSNENPDCFSVDGVKPDPSSPKRQHDTCAACPMNVFGSRVTPQGTKVKACSDTRRIAIVPADDLENELYGGAVLLRVPPASLVALKSYGDKLKAQGWPYQAVVTRISFDPDAAYPKLVFRAVRPLTEDECQTVLEHENDEKVHRMLTVEVADMASPQAPAPVSGTPSPTAPHSSEPEVPEQEEPLFIDDSASTPPEKKAKKAKATKKKPEAIAEAPTEEASDDLESMLASIVD